jgi:hypothetical protein
VPFIGGTLLLPHFTLVTLDGDSLGAVELEHRDCRSGTVIQPRNNGRRLRVLARLKQCKDDPERFAILVVEDV